MGLHQLGVITGGTRVPKEGRNSLPSTSCLPFPPAFGSHLCLSAPQRHHIRAYSMQHVVNKALTRCEPEKRPPGSRW